MNHWSAPYIGIPYEEFGRRFDGCNCWGLAVLVYQAELGIVLPDYDGLYASAEERAEISGLIADGKGQSTWQSVSDPQSFDIAVFRLGRHESHLGIIVAPGMMLHLAAGEQSKIERLAGGRWERRSTGVYRHFEMTLRDGS